MRSVLHDRSRALPRRRPATRRSTARRDDSAPVRLLVTAGPTYEPIDDVRFIGNRSSGRLGIAAAEAAAKLGWRVTLLLGPTSLTPSDPSIQLVRFRTTADLQGLLAEHFTRCDALIMAAAVADYRPVPDPQVVASGGKLRRLSAGMSLRLESTPDLLAGVAKGRREDQVVVGFALEPRSRLLSSAQEKLKRKRVDLIVANPLETMDSGAIEATVVGEEGPVYQTPRAVSKSAFAGKLVRLIQARVGAAKAGERSG